MRNKLIGLSFSNAVTIFITDVNYVLLSTTSLILRTYLYSYFKLLEYYYYL